ncbi:MAG: hypothetical protein ACI9UR_002844 [Bacteroidia bacterium]|jgi:hypothetical protein
MKINLSQSQRVFAGLIYLMVLSMIFWALDGDFWGLFFDPSLDSSLWFFSGALLIVLGKYIAEPYFSKPTDSLANSLAVIISLTSLFSSSYVCLIL